MTFDAKESVFETLNKSNATLLSDIKINHQLALAYWTNTLDRVRYHADNVHTFSFYIKGGEGSRRVDHHNKQGYQGSICLLPQHHQSIWEITAPFHFAHLYFSDSSIKQFASTALDIDPRLIEVPELTFTNDDRLQSIATKLFSGSNDSSLTYEQDVISLFESLLLHSDQATHSDRKGKCHITGGLSPKDLRTIKEYLHANYRKKILVSDLAKLTDLSDFHFLRMFKQSTGFTPGDYLTYLRVQKAATLLTSGNSLAAVAQTCGFSHQSHLTRTFKKWKGVTPGQYQKISSEL